MYLIDASIFLEIELEQEKSHECKKFLEKVEKGDIKAIITDFAIDGIALVMESHGKSRKDIRKFLISVALFEGLSIYSVKHSDKIKATEHMKSGLDFDDSIVLQSALSNGITEIVSLDKDFDKVKIIKRVEPGNLLLK